MKGVSDAEEACAKFYQVLYEIFELSVPRFNFKYKAHYYPIWFNSEIIEALQLKNLYHNKFRKYKTQHLQDQFKIYRAKC